MTTKLAQFALGIAAVFALTGADGNGCDLGNDTDVVDPDPNGGECPPDHHWDVICDDHDCAEGDPGDCYEMCVPDEVCPEDHYEEWICDDVPPPGPDNEDSPMVTYCLDPEGCEDPPPPSGECYPICVPFDFCGPGMQEEIICEENEGGPPPPLPEDEPGQPLPPSDPYEPPSDPNEPPPPGPYEECFPICVPIGEPWPEDPCPPGTYPELECWENECWDVCVPFEESQP